MLVTSRGMDGLQRPDESRWKPGGLGTITRGAAPRNPTSKPSNLQTLENTKAWKIELPILLSALPSFIHFTVFHHGQRQDIQQASSRSSEVISSNLRLQPMAPPHMLFPRESKTTCVDGRL